VTQRLEESGVEVTIVEVNLETITRQLRLDKRVYFGSVTQEQTLRQAGIDRADALILTIPDEHTVLEACRVARQLNKTIYIAARANFLSMGMLCQQAGADHVTVEEVVTAESMRDVVVQQLTGTATP
jgi:Trk K+ transport system NAD-binding subunit